MRLVTFLWVLHVVSAIQFLEPNKTTIWFTDRPNTILWTHDSSDPQNLQILFQSDRQKITPLTAGVSVSSGMFVVQPPLVATNYAIVTFLLGSQSINSDPFVIEDPSTTATATESGVVQTGSTEAATGSPSSGGVIMEVQFSLFFITLMIIMNIIHT